MDYGMGVVQKTECAPKKDRTALGDKDLSVFDASLEKCSTVKYLTELTVTRQRSKCLQRTRASQKRVVTLLTITRPNHPPPPPAAPAAVAAAIASTDVHRAVQ